MIGSILGVLFGIFLLFLVGQALWGPLRLLLSLGLRLLLGGLVLLLLNACTGAFGWTLGLNPVSAAAVGLLGLPGLLLLVALKAVAG